MKKCLRDPIPDIFEAAQHLQEEGGTGKSLGLLPFSGKIGGHRLTICKPIAVNPEFDLRRAQSGGKKDEKP